MQHSICFTTDLLTIFMADCMGHCVVVQEAQAGAYASRKSCLRECAYAWLCQLCMLRRALNFGAYWHFVQQDQDHSLEHIHRRMSRHRRM